MQSSSISSSMPVYPGAPTSRSASEFRIGTLHPAISVARRSPSRHPPPIAMSDSQQMPVSEPAFPRSVQQPQNRLAPPLCRTPPGQ